MATGMAGRGRSVSSHCLANTETGRAAPAHPSACLRTSLAAGLLHHEPGQLASKNPRSHHDGAGRPGSRPQGEADAHTVLGEGSPVTFPTIKGGSRPRGEGGREGEAAAAPQPRSPHRVPTGPTHTSRLHTLHLEPSTRNLCLSEANGSFMT